MIFFKCFLFLGGTERTGALSDTSASPSSCSGLSSPWSSSTQSSRWLSSFLFTNADDKRIHLQATEHHHQPEWLDDFQEYTNLIFLSLFTLEMLMKMYAMSFSVRQSLYSVSNETRHPFSFRATWSPSSIDSTSLLSAAPS